MSERPRNQADIIELYDDASPELQRLLQRKLGSRAEAEEIMHDAFEKLLKLRDKEHIDDLRRYFFTMANNMALNALQHRKVEQRYLATQVDTGEVSRGNTPDPGRTLEAGEQLQYVSDALSALPERTRHVFLLQRADGYSYTEIARQLGISKKGVEYHMKRAVTAVMAAMI
tara:strand:+ start:460 stop:972 length:513 start_codon:yes stop_codon:yes gene_type:complete